jgi:hypothetical protein
MTLAGQKEEANEIAEGVDQDHDFGGQAAPRTALWPDFESPFCAGAMLADPDECAIDENIFEIRIVAEGLENMLPNALARPAPKARIYGEPLAERLW